MIAEICMRHAKICVTQLCYKTTLQNSFKNQQLIPLIIGVKKASGFKSCQVSDVRVDCEDQPFCELQYSDRLFIDPMRKQRQVECIFRQTATTWYRTLFFLNNTQERFAYPICFSKAQSTSKLIIFLDLKLERANLRVMELDSRLDS